MKIAVIGYRGAGKSTLAAELARRLDLPLLHIDAIQFRPGWEERDRGERQQLMEQFLTHKDWVIDGSYAGLCWEERMEQADWILFLNFSRLLCLRRVIRRWLTCRGEVRDSAAPGCPERLDWAFLRWVVWDGRRSRGTYDAVLARYPEKAVKLNSPTALRGWLAGFLG